MNTKDPNKIPERDDYLWDASGALDPEIQRLESLLAEFRHDGRPLVLPAEMPSAATQPLSRVIQFPWISRLATAAVVLLAIAAGMFSLRRARTPDSSIAWNVVTLAGDPQVGSQTLSTKDLNAKLRVGQTLTTNSTSSASVFQDDLGEIRVDPNSRLHLLQSGPDRKRIELELGTIHAAIWAPPTQFIVETPSATAVDLGCAYTLQVAADGSGTLRTTLGWVGFHLHGRDSFIPAGAMCLTRPGIGPGTPYFEDASSQFRDALYAFDTAPQSAETHSSQLDIVLTQARARDALTLWHLLSRTTGADRAQVYDHLAALVPPPNGVTREGTLALNRQMLDRYWDALGLGRISVWRMWEQSTAPTTSSSLAWPSS
jgi:FecR protein